MSKRLQELRQKKVVDQRRQGVITLQSVVALLQTENGGLKNQLKTEVLFQTTIVEKSTKVSTLERTMETFFQNLAGESKDKVGRVEDLQEEVKALSHLENVALKKEINLLEESNTQLANEVANLQAFIDELREETPSSSSR